MIPTEEDNFNTTVEVDNETIDSDLLQKSQDTVWEKEAAGQVIAKMKEEREFEKMHPNKQNYRRFLNKLPKILTDIETSNNHDQLTPILKEHKKKMLDFMAGN